MVTWKLWIKMIISTQTIIHITNGLNNCHMSIMMWLVHWIWHKCAMTCTRSWAIVLYFIRKINQSQRSILWSSMDFWYSIMVYWIGCVNWNFTFICHTRNAMSVASPEHTIHRIVWVISNCVCGQCMSKISMKSKIKTMLWY